MKVLVIDNYDSFTYNLVQYLGELGAEPDVVRNDVHTVDELLTRGADRVVISPGPCRPVDAGVSIEAARRFPAEGVPVLGVCLGHQAMAEAFGGTVEVGEPVHGKTAEVRHDGRSIFRDVENPLTAGRYHSLVVAPDLPDELELSAESHGTVMAIRHRALPAEGVQFHPESVLTGSGKRILRNFIDGNSKLMPNDVLTGAIDAVASGRDLSAEEAQEVLAEIMAGSVGEAQTAAFLIALRTKGETIEELTGLARAMRRLAVPVEAAGDDLLDTAGTGGGVSTFNVSTTAAFVAAGAGCRVAKHGNRSATSLCGSADLLEALGARIDLDAAAVAQCVDEVGFGFMFAPAHHQAMKHVVPVRKDLGVRTIFNFLGPLTNPAGASRQLIGVSDSNYLDVIAGALVQLGATRAAVVSSEDGMDEISVSGETRLLEVTPEGVTAHTVSPERVGLERASHEAVRGGTPEQNAEIARLVLGGEPGPRRTLVVLNAGAALFVADRVSSFEDGVRLAEQAVDSGAALNAMESFVTKTRQLAPEEAVGRAG